ncbi:SDR family oxidoreductase [Ideonella sp. B508-1]|uniref:SDR family oxidoreductase n=1 Tax=Ideonella sp. B508-1 TaxID=137716 RepID=UPI0003B76D31|nr:SDR family oxidoreductase [Ideonella sp. B508-1]
MGSLFCLQAAHAALRERGGSVVLIGPSESLVGASGQVPLMTLAEGQRSLVKSAARQWGCLGIRLNWVGVAGSHYAPALAQAAFPLSPELGDPPPALGVAPEPDGAVADAVAWLAGDAARGVTGASLNLDGGDWMVP